MLRTKSSGFTLIELLITIGLMMIFMSAVWHVISYLAIASGRSGRETVELALAVRMSGRYRDDVRQALDAHVSADNSSIRLTTPKSAVEYRRGSEGRMERVDGNQMDSGPTLKAVRFDVDNSTRCVRARWTCGEAPENERPSHIAKLEEHVLILDTTMRSNGEKEKIK